MVSNYGAAGWEDSWDICLCMKNIVFCVVTRQSSMYVYTCSRHLYGIYIRESSTVLLYGAKNFVLSLMNEEDFVVLSYYR